MTTTWKRLLGLATLALCAVLGPACNKEDDPRVIRTGAADVDGQYLYTAQITRQTCGLNVPGFSGAMLVEQSSSATKNVVLTGPIVPEPDLCADRIPPFNTAEIDPAGTCLAAQYTLQGRAMRSHDRVGYSAVDTNCVVKLVGDTTLTFDGLGFTGTETYQVTAEEGCDLAFRPCEMEFELEGRRCADCFRCTDPTQCTVGACCFGDPVSCFDVTSEECAAVGGTYHGTGSACAQITCP